MVEPKEESKQALPESLKNRDLVKEMFLYTETLKQECMQDLNMRIQSRIPFDFAMESLVHYSFMADKFFMKYGVEEDDLIVAVKAMQIQKDPDVIKTLEENMKKLPPDVMMSLMG